MSWSADFPPDKNSNKNKNSAGNTTINSQSQNENTAAQQALANDLIAATLILQQQQQQQNGQIPSKSSSSKNVNTNNQNLSSDLQSILLEQQLQQQQQQAALILAVQQQQQAQSQNMMAVTPSLISPTQAKAPEKFSLDSLNLNDKNLTQEELTVLLKKLELLVNAGHLDRQEVVRFLEKQVQKAQTTESTSANPIIINEISTNSINKTSPPASAPKLISTNSKKSSPNRNSAPNNNNISSPKEADQLKALQALGLNINSVGEINQLIQPCGK